MTGFGRVLRTRGIAVGTGRILAFTQAVYALAPVTRDDVYWAGRATLVSRSEDFETYDAAFQEHFPTGMESTSRTMSEFLEPAHVPSAEAAVEARDQGVLSGFAPSEEVEGSDAEISIRMVASTAEILHSKSFDQLTEDERVRASELIRRLQVSLPVRRARRLQPGSRTGRFDLARTLRMSLRTEGEMLRRAWRHPRTKLRPLVLMLDVSGSMSPYSRALMQFGYAAASAGGRVEVFCFGTRLTRVTRVLKTKNADEALREVAETVQDWDGGTRIGESLRQLLAEHGQHVSMRRAVVVLCSDGLDRGDPELLASQMGRLGRLAYRVIWVNPLKGSPRYQPLARGMSAALPHVDTFLPGHNLASLEALGTVLAS